MSKRVEGLPPIVNNETQILIVGSFPGLESLGKKEYYANKRNNFWTILDNVLHMEFTSMNYNQRIAVLLKRNIGLWDAIASCEREGSLDSSIKNPTMNDFSNLPASLQQIVCNGRKAWKFSAKCKAPASVNIVYAPSTSPANIRFVLNNMITIWGTLLNI